LEDSTNFDANGNVACNTRQRKKQDNSTEPLKPYHTAGAVIDIRHLSAFDRLKISLQQWTVLIPLVIVYLSEYAMMSGVWSSMGFPLSDTSARGKFYKYSNFFYQLGVLISRASGFYIKGGVKSMWMVGTLQLTMLVMFFINCLPQVHLWWNNTILIPCAIAGLAGGFTYVNAFRLVSLRTEPNYKELVSTAACSFVDVGICLGEALGFGIQAYLFYANKL